MRRPPIIAVLLPFCALLAGCGIAFGDAPEGNDFFTSLRVSGEHRNGAPLTAAVAYETFYPIEIEIVCELRQGKETLREIGRGFAPAVLPERGPDDDGVPGNFSMDFTVDEPGTFKVECYTPQDTKVFSPGGTATPQADATIDPRSSAPANFIIEEFDIGSAN